MGKAQGLHPPESWGSRRKAQPGPEDEQEFNRPEDTREGIWGKRSSQMGETQCSGALCPGDSLLNSGEAAEVGRADHKEAQPQGAAQKFGLV